MFMLAPATAESRRKLIYGASSRALFVSIGPGVFAKNGLLPHAIHGLEKRLDNG
jgi:hypothetical protein